MVNSTNGYHSTEFNNSTQNSLNNLENSVVDFINNKKRKSEESEQESSKKNKASSFDTEDFLECLECPISKEPYSRKTLKGAVQLFPCGHTMSEEWAIKLLGPLNKDDFLDNKKSTCSFGCKKHVITYASNLAIMALVDRVSTKAETELFSKKLDLASLSSSSNSSNSSSSNNSNSSNHINEEKEIKKEREAPFLQEQAVFKRCTLFKPELFTPNWFSYKFNNTVPNSELRNFHLQISKSKGVNLSIEYKTTIEKINAFKKEQNMNKDLMVSKTKNNSDVFDLRCYHDIAKINTIIEFMKTNAVFNPYELQALNNAIGKLNKKK